MITQDSYMFAARTQDSIALTKHEVTSSVCEYEINGKEIY